MALKEISVAERIGSEERALRNELVTTSLEQYLELYRFARINTS
ncbi:hypothetical protein F01_50135 [Burkholderia cenocepacia]|nr:hypothetical protein F01_50135 [Burkholderia cenocepacia]